MSNLADIMSKDVHVIAPSTTVQEAAQQMKQQDVGALPICDGQKLVGMVTDRDITIRAVAKASDPRATKVTDIMSGDVVWCYDDASVEEVARTMEAKQLRRMPIIDHDKRLVGIVALADVATSRTSPETKAQGVAGVSQRK